MRKWQLTPVFFSGKSHGQRSLAGYSPWHHKEMDTIEWLTPSLHLHFGWDLCSNWVPPNEMKEKCFGSFLDLFHTNPLPTTHTLSLLFQCFPFLEMGMTSSVTLKATHCIWPQSGSLNNDVEEDCSPNCSATQCYYVIKKSSSNVLSTELWAKVFFFFFYIVVDFVIHWNETAVGLHVFPIPIPPPTSLSTRSL